MLHIKELQRDKYSECLLLMILPIAETGKLYVKN